MRALSRQDKLFSVRIPRIRAVSGMTQQALADKTGIPRAGISAIEHGKRYVTLGEAVAICDALGVTLTEMVDPAPLTLTRQVPVD